MAVFITLLQILNAWYYKELFDRIMPYGLKEILKELSIEFIVLAGITAILSVARIKLTLLMSKRIGKKVLNRFYDYILKLPIRFFDTHRVGELEARLKDANEIQEFISSVIVTLFSDIIMIVAGGIIVFKVNNKIAGIILIMGSIYIILMLLFNATLKKLNIIYMKKHAQISSFCIESFEGIQTIKNYNAYKVFSKKSENIVEEYFEADIRINSIQNNLYALKLLVELIGYIVCLGICAYDVITNKISVGQMVAVFALMPYFWNPLKHIVDLQANYQSMSASLNRINEIYELPQEENIGYIKSINNDNLPNLKINDLEFAFNSNKILKNI
ncbi:MAG: ABC transporter transmembrane domain-containing protein [Lachnotalea sp.]